MFQEFPKVKYHREEPARLVHSAAEEAGLGPGWLDVPAEYAPVDPDPAEAVEEPKPKRKGGR